jgi:hypothetical protein
MNLSPSRHSHSGLHRRVINMQKRNAMRIARWREACLIIKCTVINSLRLNINWYLSWNRLKINMTLNSFLFLLFLLGYCRETTKKYYLYKKTSLQYYFRLLLKPTKCWIKTRNKIQNREKRNKKSFTWRVTKWLCP